MQYCVLDMIQFTNFPKQKQDWPRLQKITYTISVEHLGLRD